MHYEEELSAHLRNPFHGGGGDAPECKSTGGWVCMWAGAAASWVVETRHNEELARKLQKAKLESEFETIQKLDASKSDSESLEHLVLTW